MNGILNSEVKSTLLVKHSYAEPTLVQCQDNFSDLVPSFVIVESMLNSGFYSFNLLNPMTASNFSDNAVLISIAETILEKTGLDMPGTGFSCTSTIAFC